MSPTLIIIAAKLLSKSLNNVHKEKDFVGYRLPKWSPEIIHISYADDTILFYSGNRVCIIKMMNVLKRYEKTYEQLINKAKNLFYLHDNVLLIFTIRLRKLSGIK